MNLNVKAWLSLFVLACVMGLLLSRAVRLVKHDCSKGI